MMTMDPRANVVEQGAIARRLVEVSDNPAAPMYYDDVRRLAELVLALIEWREKGGFDPFADPDAHQANPQANALLRICRRNGTSTVVAPGKGGSPGQGLPDGYIYVVEQRGAGPDGHRFECGIDTDGRVSS